MGKDQDLIEAARSGNINVVERILNTRAKKTGPLASLRRGPGANAPDASGYTSLHHSALNGHIDIVKLLLLHEATTNVVDNKGSSPLHLAAWSGNTEIVKLLLCHGPSVPNVNLMNHDSETPLHSAAQYGHSQVVSLLLQYNSDPSLRNMKGESSLDLASQYGRLEAVELILRTHPELINDNLRNHSPLHLASRNGHKQVVQALLDAGIDINLQTENGTALQEASLFGKTEVVKLLLKCGVDVDAIDSRGRTVFNIVNDLNTHVARQILKVIKNHCQLVSTSETMLDSDSKTSSTHMTPNTPPPGDIYQNILMPKRIGPQRIHSYDHDDGVGRRSYDGHRRSDQIDGRRLSSDSDQFQHSPNTRLSSGCEDSDVSSQYQTPPPPPPVEVSARRRHSASSHDGANSKNSSFTTSAGVGKQYTNNTTTTIDPTSFPPIESTFVNRYSDPESSETVYVIPPAPKQFRTDEVNESNIVSTSAPSNGGQSYLHMAPVHPVSSSKPPIPAKPPIKPPRRSVNPISPTKLKEIARQGGTVYEYLCLATSGDPKLTKQPAEGGGGDNEQYVDMSLRRSMIGSYENSDVTTNKCDDLYNGIYGRIMARNNAQNGDDNFSALYDDIASGRHVGSSYKLSNASSKSTPALNRTKTLDGMQTNEDGVDDRPTSLDIRNKRATVNIPLSPTGYEQPPTPDHPPPSPATAVAGIHEKMRPLSRDLTSSTNRLSRDNETLTEDEYFSVEDSLEDQKSDCRSLSTENKSVSTENIQTVVEDMPYAGLFRGSSKCYLNLMENQSDDVKLQVTVSSRPGRRGGGGGGAQHVYENVFIDDTKAAAVKLESSNNNNNHRNNSNNNVTIMSPFDENAEWAEIADIFASFGSGIARESVFMRDMEDKFASTLSLGAKKSDSSDTNDDADVTFDTVADWLNHVKLVDYQPLFINNGFDDVHFMHGLLEDQDLVDIGISNAEHRDRILKACKRLPPIKQVGKETDDKGGLKIRPERVDEWLKSIRLYKYKDAFHKNDYTDMYKVMKVWEVELNTVLEIHKVGHRKRILASLGERIANQYMNLPDVDLKDLDIDLSKLELDASTSSPITKEPVYPTVTKETGSLFRDYTNLKPVAPPKVPAGWKSAKAAAPKTDVTVRPPSGLTDIPSTESKQEDIGIRSPAELFSGIPTSLTTQWRHDPQALIRGSCNYTAKYLGSTLVKELKGMESTRKSIQKLKNSTKEIGKIPNVVLSMSYKGVNFIDAHTKKMVCAHEIQNIDCACQDADDLNHFAYITKEHSTSHHFCHVFSCTSMDLATEIILTLGEAFEVAYQLALREKNEKTDCKPDDVKIAETKKKCSSKPS